MLRPMPEILRVCPCRAPTQASYQVGSATQSRAGLRGQWLCEAEVALDGWGGGIRTLNLQIQSLLHGRCASPQRRAEDSNPTPCGARYFPGRSHLHQGSLSKVPPAGFEPAPDGVKVHYAAITPERLGSPTGNRTPIPGLKVLCPSR